MTDALANDEWVVVFYPTTGALRLHPTLDAAKQHIARASWEQHIYKSPIDFQRKFDHFALERLWLKVFKNSNWRMPKSAVGKLNESDAMPPDLPTEEFTKAFWEFMQRVGDRVTRLSVRQTKSKEHYELKQDKMRALVADEEKFKKTYPKQARIILHNLSLLASPFVLESELQKMMDTLVVMGHIKTKQNPWLLMQFYRPQFIKDGFIVRGDEGREEDED